MRMVVVCLLTLAAVGFGRDVALGDWPGVFLWSMTVCSAAWYLVAKDGEDEKKRRTSDHRRQ